MRPTGFALTNVASRQLISPKKYGFAASLVRRSLVPAELSDFSSEVLSVLITTVVVLHDRGSQVARGQPPQEVLAFFSPCSTLLGARYPFRPRHSSLRPTRPPFKANARAQGAGECLEIGWDDVGRFRAGSQRYSRIPVCPKPERTVRFVGDTANRERHERRPPRIETIAQSNFPGYAL